MIYIYITSQRIPIQTCWPSYVIGVLYAMCYPHLQSPFCAGHLEWCCGRWPVMAVCHCPALTSVYKIMDKAYKKSCSMTGVPNNYRMLLDNVQEDAEECHVLWEHSQIYWGSTLSIAALCLLLIVIFAAMRVSVLQHHMHEVCSCIVLHELLALPYTDPICRAGSLSLKWYIWTSIL